MKLYSYITVLLLSQFVAVHAGEEFVITTDGRLLRGLVKNVGPAIKVEMINPRRDIYLSPNVVAKRTQDAFLGEAEPVFTFHHDLMQTKKKGTIAQVVNDFKWGNWERDGTSSISLTDPKLGAISTRVFVAQITPQQVEIRGVDYEWVRVFHIANLEGLAYPMIMEQMREQPSIEKWFKCATFNRWRGYKERAMQAIEEARKLGATEDVCAAEQARFNDVNNFIRHFTNLAQLDTHNNNADDAPPVSAEILADLQKVNPTLHGLITTRQAENKQQSEREIAARNALTKRNLPVDNLTPAQVIRLEQIIQKGPELIDPAWIPALAQEWAAALALETWDSTILAECNRLAPLIAAYFAAGDAQQSEKLAEVISASPLPMTIKFSLFSHATQFPDVPADVIKGWKRIEFSYPNAIKGSHYYISIPKSYRPDVPTPVLVAMHGQTSKADVMQRVWGQYTEREGYILISPEYIYNRDIGYFLSGQEHDVVVEAMRHAAKSFNIDPDRVFLTGQSQGGHASWDIGASHAGVFAAVIPIIGVPIHLNHLANYADNSLFIIDGSEDGIGAAKMNQDGMAVLARIKADATYVEYINRGHEGFSEEYDTVCHWLRTRTRERCKTINIAALREVEKRRRWIDILSTTKPLPERIDIRPVQNVATVEGEIKPGNQIVLKTKNVTRLRILFPAEQIAFDKPVLVKINARKAWSGTLKIDWNVALKESLKSSDRKDIFLAEITIPVR